MYYLNDQCFILRIVHDHERTQIKIKRYGPILLVTNNVSEGLEKPHTASDRSVFS